MNNGYHFIPNTPYMRPIPFHQNYIQTPKMWKNGLNTSKITFSGILNGTSKTLGVINQAIPVFYQIKPIWNNAKTMFKVVRGLNSHDKKAVKRNTTTVIKKEQTNAPTFFA